MWPHLYSYICTVKQQQLGMGIFVNFSFQSSIGLKKRVLEYSGWGMYVIGIIQISEDCYENENKNMKWNPVYENKYMIRTRLDYDYDAAIVLKKEFIKGIG